VDKKLECEGPQERKLSMAKTTRENKVKRECSCIRIISLWTSELRFDAANILIVIRHFYLYRNVG
jgi:hypothetical protein